ncbi:MAG: hypothetical protein ACFFD2_14610 [Promethearchaeota archaeon]
MKTYIPVEVEEPSKGLKITGGIISIIGGAATLIIYIIYLFWTIIFGFIALIFAEPRYLLLLFGTPIIFAGAVLLFVGGIIGFTSASKTGAILAMIGAATVNIFNIILFDMLTEWGEIVLRPLVIIAIPMGIIGIIGAIILLIAAIKSP